LGLTAFVGPRAAALPRWATACGGVGILTGGLCPAAPASPPERAEQSEARPDEPQRGKAQRPERSERRPNAPEGCGREMARPG